LYDLRPAPVLTLAEQVAELQAALTAANQDADAAAAARAPIADQQAAALSQDASAANAVAALNSQIDDLTAERDNLVEIVQEEQGEPGNTGAIQAALRRIHDLEQQMAALRSGPLASAQAAQGLADQNLAAANAQLAAADAAVQSAQATVA